MSIVNRNTSDFREKVGKWLNDQGYPLEMQVAAKFRSADFRVRQSVRYWNAEGDTLREIDVLANHNNTAQGKTHRLSGVAEFNLTVCIECKLSRDKPWIIFTSGSPRTAHKWVPDVTPLCSVNGQNLYRWLYANADLKNSPKYQPTQRLGHGIVQAFSDGADIPYKAVMSAVSAATAQALESNSDANEEREIYRLGCIAIPVVVIDNTLFECYLDEFGNVSLEQVDAGLLAWNAPNGRENGGNGPKLDTEVWICTLDSLETLISYASNLELTIRDNIEPFLYHELQQESQRRQEQATRISRFLG